MGDKEIMETFRQGINEIREAKTVPWETVRAEPDL
jgi:hypothetical protein